MDRKVTVLESENETIKQENETIKQESKFEITNGFITL